MIIIISALKFSTMEGEVKDKLVSEEPIVMGDLAKEVPGNAFKPINMLFCKDIF